MKKSLEKVLSNKIGTALVVYVCLLLVEQIENMQLLRSFGNVSKNWLYGDRFDLSFEIKV